MRTEIYLRRDITAILAAILQTQQDMAQRAPSPGAQLYSAGFVAALRAVAAGFDINTEYELRLPAELPAPRPNVRVIDQRPQLQAVEPLAARRLRG